MKNMSTARRYARALTQLAKERNERDEVVQSLSNLLHASEETPQLERFLTNPLISPEDKQSVVGKITSNKLVLKFIFLLSRRKKLDLLSLIYKEVQAMADADAGLSRVLVRTPMSLTDSQKRLIETDLAHRLGGKVLGQFEVAKELLGGIWIKVGDKVLDATLKGRMEDLRYTLIHSSN